MIYSVDWTLTKCELVDMIFEQIRFLSHITLLHILNCTLNNTEEFMSITFIKTLLITSLAIIIYNVFLKKLFIKSTKKMSLICT